MFGQITATFTTGSSTLSQTFKFANPDKVPDMSSAKSFVTALDKLKLGTATKYSLLKGQEATYNND